MSNPVEQTREGGEEEEDPKPSDVNPNDHGDQSQEWEIMARAWLCSFPEAKAGSMEEVEAWIDSNHASLPGNLKSMPRSDLCQRLISIQNLMRLSTQVIPLLYTTYYFLLHSASSSCLELNVHDVELELLWLLFQR